MIKFTDAAANKSKPAAPKPSPEDEAKAVKILQPEKATADKPAAARRKKAKAG